MSAFKELSTEQVNAEYDRLMRRGLAYVAKDFPLEIYNPKEGVNKIRLVPPLADDPDMTIWGFDIYVTYYDRVPYLSPRTFEPEADDPAEAFFNRMRQENPEIASRCRPTKRVFLYVLDLDEENPDRWLKIWPAPSTLANAFVKASKDMFSGEVLSLSHHQNGRVVVFTKTGQGLQTRYDNVQIAPEPMPIGEEIATQIKPMREILLPTSAEEMHRIIEQFEAGGYGDAAFDDVPDERAQGAASAQSSVEATATGGAAGNGAAAATNPATTAPAPSGSDWKAKAKAKLDALASQQQKQS